MTYETIVRDESSRWERWRRHGKAFDNLLPLLKRRGGREEQEEEGEAPLHAVSTYDQHFTIKMPTKLVSFPRRDMSLRSAVNIRLFRYLYRSVSPALPHSCHRKPSRSVHFVACSATPRSERILAGSAAPGSLSACGRLTGSIRWSMGAEV
jgi:hypothetical protein